MPPLDGIPISKIETVKGPGRVVVFWLRLIMALDKHTKCIFAVLAIVQILLMKNCSWTVMGGDPMFGRKEVEFLFHFP